MSEEKEETFWDSVVDFFKSVSLKLKLILGTIIGVFGFIAVFLLRKNINEGFTIIIKEKR